MCCYGGGSKWEQSKALEGGAEIIVGTPGRVIDLVKMSATNLTRVTFLVLDEADRMFNMGFGKCDQYYLLIMCSVNKCVILMFECICM